MARRGGNRLDSLIKEFEPSVQKAFRESVDNIRNPASMSRLIQHIDAFDIDAVARELKINPASFRPIDKAVSEAFEVGGNFAAKTAPVRGSSVTIQFDMRNATAERILRDQSAKFVSEVSADTRNVISQTLSRGMERGQNPKTTALDLVGRVNMATGRREGGAIGLTASQEQWVSAYADKLREGDPSALEYNLRDKRFDRIVRKAQAEGRALSEAEIRSMVVNYRNRALRYRAETIARTETLTAMNAATYENMRQMIERGEINEAIVQKVWFSSNDGKVRHTHTVLNKTKVPFRADFVSPSGARLLHPGDPNAPAAEIINCRCWLAFDADFFAGLE